jgi:CheY-like chemotaxis protein
LVVEDVPEMRELIRVCIQQEVPQALVRTVGNLPEAEKEWIRMEPEWVFLDQTLGLQSGLDLLKDKQIEGQGSPGTRVVLLVAGGGPGVLPSGIARALTKPNFKDERQFLGEIRRLFQIFQG